MLDSANPSRAAADVCRVLALAALLALCPACDGGDPVGASAPDAGTSTQARSEAAASVPPDVSSALPVGRDEGIDEPGFVGTARCATCHPGQAEAWTGSHHDLALARPTETTVLGDFDDSEIVVQGVRWRFSREGDAWIVHRSQDGAPTERLEVVATFGVTPLQQVLVSRSGGRLQALPVAWGARPESGAEPAWFALAPDAPTPVGDPLHWDGLAYRWNTQCAACHSTGVRKGWNDASGRYRTTWAEEDVACEACHGPGARHVDWAEGRGGAGAAESADDRGLAVRFEAWDAEAWPRAEGAAVARRARSRTHDAQLDVCAPCHARRSELVAAPEIGEPMLDGYAPELLARGLYFDDGGIRDEVYVWGSFLQSRMYAAGVRCSDCHEPHSGGLRREGDALCTGCHAPARYAGDAHFGHAGETAVSASCIDCHMPERVYMQVDARRDHAFAIPDPARHRALGSTDACRSCHPGVSSDWQRAAIDAWRGATSPAPHWSDALLAEGRAREDPERWLDVAGSPLATDWVRGSAWARFAQESPSVDEAIARIEKTGSDSAGPLERLGRIEVLRRSPIGVQQARLVPLLDDPARAVRVAAAEALAALPANALRPDARASLADALGEYRAAQAANADRPEAQVNLGTLAARVGDATGARAAYRKAIEHAPYFVPAHVNLADLARAEGDDAEAMAHLRRALEIDPSNAVVRYALGLALHRSGDAAGALEALARAARDAPEHPRLVLGHALALSGAGRLDAAIRVLDEAIERGVDDPTLHHALVGLLRDAGRIEPAREGARRFRDRFPGDSRARTLARELGLSG